MLGHLKWGQRGRAESSTGYEKLLADESSVEEQRIHIDISPRTKRTSYVRHLLIDLGVALILLAAFFSWSYSEHHKGHNSIDWTPCGNTSAEARAAGCHYEPMQRSWIPHACYFDEPVNDYHPFDDREWFYDMNLTRRLDDEGMHKLRTGGDLVAYTHFFHNEHCIYCWRKLAIAVERRLPMIDSKTASIHHSTHCAHLLSEEIYDVGTGHVEQYDHQATISPLMFQTCVQLDWK